MHILLGDFPLALADSLNMQGEMETFLTVGELASRLKLAEQTIRRWVMRREIPFLKIGKAVRFRPSDVERWASGTGITAGTVDGGANGVSGSLFDETETDAGGNV